MASKALENENENMVVAEDGVERAPLVVADRCDRCGAQAQRAVGFPGGGELLFCAHHFNRHRDALEKTEAIVLY